MVNGGHKPNVWEIMQCPEYVLKCNKSVHLPARVSFLLHFSTYLGHCIVSHTFFLCPQLTINLGYLAYTPGQIEVKRLQYFMQYRATLFHPFDHPVARMLHDVG